MQDNRVADVLHSLALAEGLTTTSNVLIAPSGDQRSQALRCVESCSITTILDALAHAVAEEVSNEMSAAGLRASDYAELPELPKIVAKRLIAELQKLPETFQKELKVALKLKG